MLIKQQQSARCSPSNPRIQTFLKHKVLKYSNRNVLALVNLIEARASSKLGLIWAHLDRMSQSAILLAQSEDMTKISVSKVQIVATITR